MRNSEKVLLTGARDSKLSVAQSRQNIDRLEELLPELKFELVPMSSPGDRDRVTDLRVSEPDFFTRDLDDAVLNGSLDCAVHSAKDLPPVLREGLDMLCLPWIEDRRDVLVYPEGREPVAAPRIGVSSQRREEYSKKKFPDGRVMSIRGNIEDRIRQLDEGKYDVLIMAAAGLSRLGLAHRISEYVSLEELPTPEAQGQIAVTFRKGDNTFCQLRKLFVKRAVLAGAGVGSKNNVTNGVVEALKDCDVCMYDALCPHDLLDFLPDSAEAIYVGKRKGEHSIKQDEICALLVDYIRKGKKVVRLKGGDPGVFGRLAEETEVLDEYELPYTVMPGISSLAVATTGTGLLLTRRGINRGFTVATPRKQASAELEWFRADEYMDFTRVFLMGASEVESIASNLVREGHSKDTPVSIVYNAGYPEQLIVTGTLGDIKDKLPQGNMPGIILAGHTADKKFLFKNNGALAGKRILFTGSELLAEKAEKAICSFGGIPVIKPMIELKLEPDVDIEAVLNTDILVVPSPSCAKLLLEAMKRLELDIRRLSGLAVCGSGTADVFKQGGIIPDICAGKEFGAAGLIEVLNRELTGNEKVVRLCSDKASFKLSEAIGTDNVVNVRFYTNSVIRYDRLPEFDAVMFSSPSSVKAFIDNFSVEALSSALVCAIGEPTSNELKNKGIEAVLPQEATVEAMVFAVAAEYTRQQLRNL
jgi:uroporphyrinogen III methyltransferase/synthase